MYSIELLLNKMYYVPVVYYWINNDNMYKDVKLELKDTLDVYKNKFYECQSRIKLGLTHADREKIVPQYMSEKKKLFRYSPESFEAHRIHTKHWWEKLNLSLIEAFISRSPDKENNRLGATYCVMGLVAINDKAAEVFPWLT